MATKQETFEWRVAFSAANEIRQKLEPYCQQTMIVGSLRRQCETVHDIDIVLIPKPDGELGEEHLMFRFNLDRIMGEGWEWAKGKAKMVSGTYAGIPVDLYFATPDTWWTLVVIRTGSAASNIRLCSLAKSLGMKLHADGRGLEELHTQVLCAINDEHDLFKWLQLDYVEPKDRR